MGVMDRFEKGIERAVNGAFAKAFRSEVQPVEIASALRRESDAKASPVSRDRILAPNVFVVELGPADHERLEGNEAILSEELQTIVTEHSVAQRYQLVGPVSITFEEAEDLDTGLFRVRSSTEKIEGPDVASSPPPHTPAHHGRHERPNPSPAPLPQPVRVTPPPPPPGAVRVSPSLDIDGERYWLNQPVTVIGRGAEADITVDDAGVSRRHSEIHLLDGVARIVDLGSTNGTFVNGTRRPVVTLVEGSVITIGRTRIVFHAGHSGGPG